MTGWTTVGNSPSSAASGTRSSTLPPRLTSAPQSFQGQTQRHKSNPSWPKASSITMIRILPKQHTNLASILNSAYLDTELKPLQSKGDFGPRDIHKKMWAFPVPLHDPRNEAHQKLASLAADCGDLVKKFLEGVSAKAKEGSLGRLRGLIRQHLAEKLREIDLVSSILEI